MIHVPSKEQIEAAERQYNLHLVNLKLEPIPPKRNLYGTKPQAAIWSESRPFHWLPAAERGDRQAMLELGILYDRANDLPRAETWYHKAAEAGEPEAKERLEARRLHATALWATLPQGHTPPAQYDQVLDLCNRVIALDPNHVDAYRRRGLIFAARGDTRLTEADFRKVIELAPQDADAHVNLVVPLVATGRFADALPIATKAHELAPANYFFTAMVGHIYLLTGDRQTARQYYEKVIPLIPDEATLTSKILPAFDQFIKQGWQTEAFREEAAWFRKRFAEHQAKPH